MFHTERTFSTVVIDVCSLTVVSVADICRGTCGELTLHCTCIQQYKKNVKKCPHAHAKKKMARDVQNYVAILFIPNTHFVQVMMKKKIIIVLFNREPIIVSIRTRQSTKKKLYKN